MLRSTLLALALTLSSTEAVFQGFNSGASFTNDAAKQQSDFESEFSTAKKLVGTNSAFTSVRLFTSIQHGTTNTPISAFPAAIKEDVSILLGLWGSAGETNIQNEIAAIKSAISTYGDDFTKRVAGISVGSEDLYRVSEIGVKSNAGIGAGPDVIAKYIRDVKEAFKDTPLSGSPVGHVDTWTVYVNDSNKAVIDAADFIGMDAYPYFQNTMANSIDNAKQLFFDAFAQTKQRAGGKPVWVTETGWPVSGKTEKDAVPSTQNAEKYWKDVGCSLFGKENTWWFILQDSKPTTPNPSFGIVGSELSTTASFDLSCDDVSSSSSSSASSSGSTKALATSSSSAASSSSTGVSTGSADGSSGVIPETGSGSDSSDSDSNSGSSSGSSGSSSSSGSSDSGSSGSSASGSIGAGSPSPTGLLPSATSNSTASFTPVPSSIPTSISAGGAAPRDVLIGGTIGAAAVAAFFALF